LVASNVQKWCRPWEQQTWKEGTEIIVAWHVSVIEEVVDLPQIQQSKCFWIFLNHTLLFPRHKLLHKSGSLRHHMTIFISNISDLSFLMSVAWKCDLRDFFFEITESIDRSINQSGGTPCDEDEFVCHTFRHNFFFYFRLFRRHYHDWQTDMQLKFLKRKKKDSNDEWFVPWEFVA